MSKTTIELTDMICQTLTVRYSPHRRQALAQAAKEMGCTVEQIMASYLAHQIARRFDLTPKAGDKPSVGGESSAEQPLRR